MNSMRKGALLVFVLILIAVTVFSITKPKDQVTIGVLVPLTGPSAGIGERVKAGIEAGVAEIRAQGGYDFKVVYEDDQGQAPVAVSAAKKLITSDGVRIIIGTVKSDAMLAVAPVTEEAKVILLSPTAGAEAISEAGDFVFRLIETPDIHGQAAAEYIGSDKKVALFVAKAANAQSYGKFFKERFETSGGTISFAVEYSADDTDFRTDIAKAKASGAEVFYLAVSTAKDAGILTKQIRGSGFTGLVMASVAADAKEFFDAAGAEAEGAIITASYFDNTSAAGAKFNTRYKAITGNDGDGFAANGYDAVMLIAQALRSCGGADTVCVRDYLYAVTAYQGAGGTLSFDAHGDVTKPVSIKVAGNGLFVIQK